MICSDSTEYDVVHRVTKGSQTLSFVESGTHMQHFQQMVKSLGGIWSKNNTYFSGWEGNYIASHIPQINDNHTRYIMEWNNKENQLTLFQEDFGYGAVSKGRTVLLYLENGVAHTYHPKLKQIVDDVSILVDFTKQQDFVFDKSFLEVNPNTIGYVLHNEMEYFQRNAKDYDELGRDIQHILSECTTKEQYDAVNKVIKAVSGRSLESIFDHSKDLESEADRHF